MINITCINDLLNEIKKNYMNEELDYSLWYRGHSVIDWDLTPSVQRGNYAEKEVEQYLVNDFYARACVSSKDRPHHEYCGWITMMQHFGLPTRLLDWSLSPLVALFFATNDYKKYPQNDGCIWMLRPGLLNEMEGFGSYIYPMDKYSVTEMIKPAFNSKLENKDFADKIIACYPLEYNMRIYTQQSAFTVHNSVRKLTSNNNSNLLIQYRIPSEFKQYILKELKLCGISLRTVYPDVEHIAEELKDTFN